METNAKYVLVGASVLALLTLLGLSIYWLRLSSSDAGLRFFEVYFENQSLAGLRDGSVVTMKGIPVGLVDRIDFDHSNTQRVRVTVAISETTPVREDSTAVVNRNIVTGLSTIDLSMGSRQGKLLPGAKRSSSYYPILKEGSAELEAIRQSVPALLEQSSDVLALIEAALSDENRKRAEQILKNIEAMSAQLASEEQGVTPLVRDMRSLVAKLKEAVGSMKSTAQGIERSISELSDQLGESTGQLTATVTDAARRVADTAQRFQNPGRLLRGNPPSELGPGEEEP
jgi:phospholipid/cholesterol/gamma-HCH transport system substrate-binding protein